jgi:hypothetical protein
MANNLPQLLSGARGVIQKSNPTTGALETICYATDINVNVRVGVRTSYVMGRMNGAANDSLSYDVDVSLGRVIPMQSSDGSAPGTPWVPPTANGQKGMTEAPTAVASGLEPIIKLITSTPDLTIALFDQVTGQYVNSVIGCRFAGRTEGTNAGDVGSERLNYVGLYDAGYASTENSATTGYGL